MTAIAPEVAAVRRHVNVNVGALPIHLWNANARGVHHRESVTSQVSAKEDYHACYRHQVLHPESDSDLAKTSVVACSRRQAGDVQNMAELNRLENHTA